MEVLDISESEPEFIESQWVGRDIPYPHDHTPSSIVIAHSKKFNPPLDLKCISSRTDSVSTLTTAILPKQSHALQTHPLGSWFSYELPNTSLDILTHATEQVPSPELLDQLWNISGDM
ncbi:hypothetical protein NLI96_g7982 [Meripilus lineatus]|uniref:Uncharacterized protein n=1 Tax=Meripilus lineatus TaxID=2056292 RepID=A0AAD5V3C1_9APHY|nr:hypothetical protein NLI96_g7982 [Physisporinus lineatus]